MKNFLRFLLVPALVCVMGLSPVSAQTAEKTPPMPEVLKELGTRGAQIRYLGRDKGLDGWATILQGQEQYFYVTPDGEAIIMGLLFDKSGHPVTIDQVAKLQSGDAALDALATPATPTVDPLQAIQEELRAQQNLSPSQRLMKEVEASNMITLGKNADAPVIYAFMDPQCPHCHALMNDLRKDLLATGQIQIKMIPVGLRDETKAQAAYLLAAPDAEDRWYKHLDGDDKALPIDPAINKQGVERNLLIMQNWKLDATPILLYRSKAGEIKMVRGRPRDLAEITADLF